MDDDKLDRWLLAMRNKGIAHNRVLGRTMQAVPRSDWPLLPAQCGNPPLYVWISREYLAQLYRDGERDDGTDCLRLSVNRTRRDGFGWRDGITWDELQRVKNECLGEETWCAEAYPAESEKVNVANIRHLYVLDHKPDWARLS